MYLALAFALVLAPFVALYAFERLAKAGMGPLAQPHRMTVVDGTTVAAPVIDRVDPEPGDTEGCLEESRLVTALIAGRLTRPEYQHKMADLAARDADVRPVRLPPGTDGSA